MLFKGRYSLRALAPKAKTGASFWPGAGGRVLLGRTLLLEYHVLKLAGEGVHLLLQLRRAQLGSVGALLRLPQLVAHRCRRRERIIALTGRGAHRTKRAPRARREALLFAGSLLLCLERRLEVGELRA